MGWTFSDGVSGTPDGAILADYTRIDPKDELSWGGRVGFFATPNLEVGALLAVQPTTLQLEGRRFSRSGTRGSTTTTATCPGTSARWTPTYIRSDAVGWWCDPYWGCYTVGDAQYANQFEVSAGLNLRF